MVSGRPVAWPLAMLILHAPDQLPRWRRVRPRPVILPPARRLAPPAAIPAPPVTAPVPPAPKGPSFQSSGLKLTVVSSSANGRSLTVSLLLENKSDR